MRSLWRGAVSFGLVTVAVRLYRATEEHDFRFHQVHREDGGRIRYQRVCSVCGKQVGNEDIAKGYEFEDGRMVMLGPEDFESLPIKTEHAIEVLEFVPAAEVDPIFFQKSYYLEPDKAAVRPYVLLRRALEEADLLAVVKITLRQRETLAMLRARNDVLVLHTMLWPDEVRKPEFSFLSQDVEIRPQELQMASSLVQSMAGDFEPDQFSDDYREALGELISAKAEGAEIPERPEPEREGEVIDLMTALERSVEQARTSRDGTGDQDRRTSRGRSGGGGKKKAEKEQDEKTTRSGSTRRTGGRKSSA
ncbi:Ku protein [Actinoalloteichus sp. AHMU CJ021]|uniref:Non-homologous end joining protein Ku n=1 Tax=Actinoalloteichus caeruleus DSM 43889 TaxID=1120930 RepID=A0ABT1JGV0_ACTCY|nr:Ku protein [Actinoalloteichus caeruleus]AUS77754.1 Ku protein [Actinoalloteichus sp. AHMU CJ021]MCP2331692.1 DNA end-binding protein Ku [Actinoalloteichus caeruleus DSM 43889]